MPQHSFFKTGFDAWSLALEANSVIALRMLKMAAGGSKAQAEAQLMISEKITAGLSLQTMALTGRLGTTIDTPTNKTIAHYRRKVRANQRRLMGT